MSPSLRFGKDFTRLSASSRLTFSLAGRSSLIFTTFLSGFILPSAGDYRRAAPAWQGLGGAASSPAVRAVARILFVLAGGEESFARVQAEGAGAEGYVALRVGYLDARLAEEAGDSVVDVAPDGRVSARPVRPDEQAELEVVVAEVEELHARLRLFEQELHALGRAQERVPDELGVRVRRDADGDGDARAALAESPVEEVLVDYLRVGHDGGDVVVRHDDGRAEVYAADAALGELAVGAGYGYVVAYAHGPLEEDYEARGDVARDEL